MEVQHSKKQDDNRESVTRIHLYTKDMLRAVVDGIKVVEIRLGTPRKYKHLINHKLTLYQGSDSVEVRVLKILHYNTLVELVQNIPRELCAPQLDSQDEMLDFYRSMLDNNREFVFRNNIVKKVGGVVAIVFTTLW
jgi:ASC-1-like (ASCH) protein